MTLSEKYQFLVDFFTKNNPNAQSELVFHNSFELLVAVVLSAQCTDKRVNLVTKEFFAKYPTPQLLATASITDIYEFIKSVSYPNNKAAHLSGLAKMLVADFDGEVPGTLSELIRLPGVGRKTANVILSIVYNQPAMAVDTHVFRVAHRLGIVENAPTPIAVEKQLTANFPQEQVARAHHWLILHGRYVCTARKPKCAACGLAPICLFFQNNFTA